MNKIAKKTTLYKLYRESLDASFLKGPSLRKTASISENLKHHISNNIALSDNIFRIYSKSYFDIFNEARDLVKEGSLSVNEDDLWLLNTDIGKFAEYNGELVPLDIPIILMDEAFEKTAAEKKKKNKQKLNSPRRIHKGEPGYGRKKFIVYVRNPSTGKAKAVTFGHPDYKIKNNDPKASKSFRARHRCSQEKNKLSANYWACNVGRYWKQLGLSSNKPW